MAGSPVGLVGTPATPTATPGIGLITLSWPAVPGASGYDVLRSTVSGGPYTLVASNLSGTNFTNAGLSAGSTFYYVVAAYTAASEGIYTAIQTALTGGADPLTALQQSAPNK